MQNRKIAEYGALATLPSIPIEACALVLRYLHDPLMVSKPFWEHIVVALGTAIILTIPSGAAGALLIVKAHERYRSRFKIKSRTAAYAFLAFLFWAIIYLSISLIDLIRLVGVILWALILAHFIDKLDRATLP